MHKIVGFSTKDYTRSGANLRVQLLVAIEWPLPLTEPINHPFRLNRARVEERVIQGLQAILGNSPGRGRRIDDVTAEHRVATNKRSNGVRIWARRIEVPRPTDAMAESPTSQVPPYPILCYPCVFFYVSN